MNSIYDFQVKALDGKLVPLASYKGKVLLVVNVASKCGFTYQYEGLEKLYKNYEKQGLVMMGFPCNQFGAQEPGNADEIKNFCSLTYDVTFPMFSKVEVNGDNAEPLFKYLKAAKPGFLGTQKIKWNFTKFLIDKNGKVIKRYAPTVKPEAIESDIKALL